jgi:hypothetical protein
VKIAVTIVNHSHLNRLSIVMRFLEDAVAEVESAVDANANGRARIMSINEDPVPEAVRAPIRDKLAKIRDSIKDAKDYYGLSSQPVSIRRRLSSTLLMLAIDLTECKSQHLRSYGEVPNEEKEPLDERMSRLEAMVNEIRRLLNTAD